MLFYRLSTVFRPGEPIAVPPADLARAKALADTWRQPVTLYVDGPLNIRLPVKLVNPDE